MSKPFEVEVDCGSATPVHFQLTQERIRGHPGIKVRHAVADNQSDPDARTRLWRGALTIGRGLIEASAGGPIEIYEDPDLWVIPEHSVRWVRLHDPESPDGRSGELGFRMPEDHP